jgi:hypothetical protein
MKWPENLFLRFFYIDSQSCGKEKIRIYLIYSSYIIKKLRTLMWKC